MVDKWNITIPELTGEEERLAYIYLPESYLTERRKRYRVRAALSTVKRHDRMRKIV